MRIGIITHYYNSENYGGNLQAYALCRVLSHMGHEAEQICYRADCTVFGMDDGEPNGKQLSPRTFAASVKRLLFSPFGKAYRFIARRNEERKHSVRENRRRAFSEFNKSVIPHSERVYDPDSVFECVGEYDAFITGSDQVWNLNWYDPSYFLSFAPSRKVKLSYAASLGMKSFTPMQAERVREHLRDFRAVSVREKDAVSILDGVSSVKAEWTLDPTLLLSPAEWDALAGERSIKEKYVLCYFLGDDKRIRRTAARYAARRGLKLVNIPHSGGVCMMSDIGFGDIRLYNVSPNRFVELIKNAEYVFTDSFHATVFSGIYKKRFFVFQRFGKKDMASRIYILLELFGCEERFCDSDEKMQTEYLDSLGDVGAAVSSARFCEKKEQSLKFLRDNLPLK